MKKDEFSLSIDNLGELKKVNIRHDNSGFGAAWYLEKIEIKDTSNDKL